MLTRCVNVARSQLAQCSRSLTIIREARKFSTSLAWKVDAATNGENKSTISLPFKDASGSEILLKIDESLNAETSSEYAASRAYMESILNEYDAVLKDLDEYAQKYKRALAETENVRSRGNRLVEEAKSFAVQSFCKDLLEVADILDVAVASMEKDSLTKADKKIQDFYNGVALTKTVLHKKFESHGLVPIDPKGEKFDPNIHEAIVQIPTSQVQLNSEKECLQANVEAGVVAVVTKIGYSLKGRPIRAAQVGVAVDS